MFYLRVFRTILYRAKDDGLVEISDNLFPSIIGQYNEPIKSFKEKPAQTLGRKELKKIEEADLSADPFMSFARDLFIFSYNSRGMELFDILNLKKENIRGDVIVYNKRLTGTRKTVKIEPEALRIIRKYSKDNPEDTIFYAIHDYTKSEKFSTYQHLIAPRLKEMGRILGIKIPIIFSTARITWNSMSKESDLSSLMLE